MHVPMHLSLEASKWWRYVYRGYALELHHVQLLTLACEAWDRGQQARMLLASEGLVYHDRFNSPKARPEVAIERDSRISFARLLRELDLDLEAPTETPRAPALKSNRGLGHAS